MSEQNDASPREKVADLFAIVVQARTAARAIFPEMHRIAGFATSLV
jgi:hypothetical protein